MDHGTNCHRFKLYNSVSTNRMLFSQFSYQPCQKCSSTVWVQWGNEHRYSWQLVGDCWAINQILLWFTEARLHCCKLPIVHYLLFDRTACSSSCRFSCSSRTGLKHLIRHLRPVIRLSEDFFILKIYRMYRNSCMTMWYYHILLNWLVSSN